MKRHSQTVIRLVVSLFMALAVLIPTAGTANLPVASAATTASGELTRKGAWAAYNFFYTGDGSELRISVSYTPADPYTDGAVFLDLYSPTDPPPKGTKIATGGAGDREGTKQLLLSSFEGGKYTVILSAYDFFGRPVQFNLYTGFSSGKQGPDLTFVSSSEPSLAAAPPPAPPVADVAPAEPPVAPATPPAPAIASQPVSGYPTFTLGRKGAWSAYRVHYPGDWSELRIIAVYDPSDLYTDGGMVIDLYSPVDPPPTGTKIASATPGYRPGVQAISLRSDIGGDYILFVSNWDFLNRPVQVTILTSDSNGDPGPPLTYVSSRP